MNLTPEEKKALIDEIGVQGAAKLKEVSDAATVEMKALLSEVKEQKGGLTEEQHKAILVSQKSLEDKIEEISKEHGSSITDLKGAISKAEVTGKTIAEKLKDDEEELKRLYGQSGVGQKAYMLTVDKSGNPVLKNFVHGTIDGLEGGLASVAQSFDASSILRMGAGGTVLNQYRNTPFIFDLCNTITTSPDQRLAFWIDEIPKIGSSALVPEGETKPKVQYNYELKSSPYKKEAKLISFTDEFSMDFSELEQNIMNQGRVDLINKVNAAILPNITTAATAYNTATEFKAGVPITNPHDFDAIAAMSAQVDSATFGSASANAALMSTFKKYRIGIQRDNELGYINSPQVLDALSYVGNPEMGADEVMVGDFSQYNILLRGGIIVKVGYNGTDFAENKFSVVMEQFYYDYISSARTNAIVKGANFADVKTAISA